MGSSWTHEDAFIEWNNVRNQNDHTLVTVGGTTLLRAVSGRCPTEGVKTVLEANCLLSATSYSDRDAKILTAGSGSTGAVIDDAKVGADIVF